MMASSASSARSPRPVGFRSGGTDADCEEPLYDIDLGGGSTPLSLRPEAPSTEEQQRAAGEGSPAAPASARRLWQHRLRRWAMLAAVMVLGLGILDAMSFAVLSYTGSVDWSRPKTYATFVAMTISAQIGVVVSFFYCLSRPDLVEQGRGPLLRALPADIDKRCPLRTDQEGTCVICLDEIQCGETTRGLQCGHVIHAACLDDWWQRQTQMSMRCPTCRRSVMEEADDKV